MKAKNTKEAYTKYIRTRSALRGFFFPLTLPLFSVVFPTASYAACGAHEQLCIFHSLGAPVNLQAANLAATQIPAGNNLYIYFIGTDPVTGLPSNVDADNKVLLPAKTGNKAVVGSANNYTTPTTPIIVSSTAYGAANPPPMWDQVNNTGIGALQVYGSQYQVIFNNLTSTARITGDPGGGEEFNIPNSTSCQNLPAGARNCEAVQVSGNVPSGFYEQKVRIFNFPGVANPKVDIQAGAYVTGNLILISSTHLREDSSQYSLTGTGAMTPAIQYEVYNRDFNPHAAGVASFDHTRRSTRYGDVIDQGNHTTRNIYRDTYTTHNTVWGDPNQGYLLGDGRTAGSSKTYSSSRQLVGVDVVMKPVQPTQITPSDLQVAVKWFKDNQEIIRGIMNPLQTAEVYIGKKYLEQQHLAQQREQLRQATEICEVPKISDIPSVLSQGYDTRTPWEKTRAAFANADRESRVFNEPFVTRLNYGDAVAMPVAFGKNVWDHPIGTAADFTPYVGDIKAFKEAETIGDYIFATVGLVPVFGDAANKAWKTSKIVDNLPPVPPPPKLHSTALDITDPKNWTGCEACAKKIQNTIGGDIHRINPPIGAKTIGDYMNTNQQWDHHDVVVKDNMVYDAFHPNGISVSDFKKLFDAADYIEFGF